MNNRTRTTSRNAAIGVALLALSGSLLAADVVMSRAVQPEQSDASSLALAVPVASAQVTSAPVPSAPAAAAPPARAKPASREAHRSPPHTIFAAVVVRHVERPHAAARARPERRNLAATSSPARKATGARPAPSKARSVLAVERVTRHPAPATVPARVTVVAARTVARPDARPTSRPSLPVARQASPPRRAGRSAVEAAQYFAVKTVEAQTPGLEHVAAVTRKRGTNRLVVHIIAKTRDGTLVEFEVLRRNGIGFAVESKTSRFVALSAREKAASPAKRVAGR